MVKNTAEAPACVAAQQVTTVFISSREALRRSFLLLHLKDLRRTLQRRNTGKRF